ncbi:MAG: ABC transporter substrate-binding protein [Hyphomicrobiaceae bacterium]
MPILVRLLSMALMFAMLSGIAYAQTPKRGGVLNFAVTAEPSDYDCHASQTYALLHPISPFYSYLVKFDAANNSKIVGDLAESWTVSPDGLVYTFKLHDGVKFHDGTPMTSEDVRASFDRIANPPQGVVSLRKSAMEIFSAIETPDASTIVFKLAEPNASALDTLASPFNCIYSAEKIKQDPKFPQNNILGTGAYQPVEHVRGSHFTAKRFDGYFRKGVPLLDGYKALFVKASAVVSGLRGGQFDAEFRGRTPSERDQLMNSADKDKWVLHEGPWGGLNIIIFNVTKKPFDDPRVRRALSLAIDRWNGNEALSKVTFVKQTGGFVRPGYELALPPKELEQFPGYWRDVEKSRAEARRLLKEAGVENLSIKLHNRNVSEPYTPVAIFIIDQWKRIGVNVEHSQVETTPFFGNLVEGKFDVALLPPAMAGDDVTPYYQYYLTNKRSPLSYARHTDEKIDDLWLAQARELDPAKRKAIVADLERHMLTQNYYLSINWWQRIIVHHKRMKGWPFSPSHFQGVDLMTVWLDE